MSNYNYENIEFSLLRKHDIKYLEDILLDEKGYLKILPYQDLRDISQEHLSIFCVKHGLYNIPTKELIQFLENEIGNKMELGQTIEIGAGNGSICRELKIVGTDNYMQLLPEVKKYYESLKQNIVQYGSHVLKLDALEAVRRYQPEIVIGAYITHKYNPNEHWRGGNEYGVNEEILLKKVNKYIHIGNEKVHNKKPILGLPHKVIKEPWILSRSQYKEYNVIQIWNK